MNPAEIVISEVQAVGTPKVVPLLTESVRKPREAAHLHTNGEILTLYNRRTDAARIGAAHNWDHLRAGDFGGATGKARGSPAR